MAEKKKQTPTEAASVQADPTSIVGRKIINVRPMQSVELRAMGWTTGRHGPPIAIVLDDGTKLYPSRDEEGNGPGAVFGVSTDGGSFMVG